MNPVPNKAVWEGTFMGIRCYVLDDGQRIIHSDDAAKLLESMSDASVSDVEAFARFIRGEKVATARGHR